MPLSRQEYVHLVKQDLIGDMNANPLLTQRVCPNRGGIYLADRRAKSGVIADVVLYMSKVQREQGGGLFKWHPFHNALSKNGWERGQYRGGGILAGGVCDYTKRIGSYVWKIRLPDHNIDCYFDEPPLRWDIDLDDKDSYHGLHGWLYVPEYDPVRIPSLP